MAAKPTLLLFIVFAVVLEAALGSPAPKDQEGTRVVKLISKNKEDNPDSETGTSIPQLLTADGSQQGDAAVESREEESRPGVSADEKEQEELDEKEDRISNGGDDEDSDDDDSDDTEAQDAESLSEQVKNVDTRDVEKDDDDEEDEEKHAQEKQPLKPAYLKADERPSIRDDNTFVVYDTDDKVCILADVRAKFTLQYPDKQDNEGKVVVSPDYDTAKVTGNCDRVAKSADLVVAWDAFVFTISFQYEERTQSWYVSQFKLEADLSSKIFQDSKSNEKVTLTSPEDKRYWQTKEDRSFRCPLLHDVSLSDKTGEYWGSIHMNSTRVQAFSDIDNFKTPKHCSHRRQRDEMVPITVGAVLASLTLVTITGYAIFRYFKIKKVQYDTME